MIIHLSRRNAALFLFCQPTDSRVPQIRKAYFMTRPPSIFIDSRLIHQVLLAIGIYFMTEHHHRQETRWPFNNIPESSMYSIAHSYVVGGCFFTNTINFCGMGSTPLCCRTFLCYAPVQRSGSQAERTMCGGDSVDRTEQP